MWPIWFAVVLLVAYSTFPVLSSTQTVVRAFKSSGVIPDVVPVAPPAMAYVMYPHGVEVQLGNEISPSDAATKPTVVWDYEPQQYYTVAMIDPDALSRADYQLREIRHWLVANVPGNEVALGQQLTAYLGPHPFAGTGQHRYVILVYKQNGLIIFDEETRKNLSENIRMNRAHFHIAEFANNYGMGHPTAGNFYLSAKCESDSRTKGPYHYL